VNAQIQADERYGPSGYTYISGNYEPIGQPPSAADLERQQYQHQQYQQQQQQQQYVQQQQQGAIAGPAAVQDMPKSAPPPYGAV
jgi:transcription initiation factor TFIID subunit TAF12